MAQASRLVRYLLLFTLVVTLLAACDLFNPPPEGDTEPPTVTLESSTSSVAAAEPITLTATAEDNVGVTKVEFFMDDGASAVRTDKDGSDGFTYQATFTAADNGNHSFTARAFDAAGNTANSNKVAVEVAIDGNGDTEPPAEVVLTGPSSVTTTDPVSYTVTATDNIGVVKVEFYRDDEDVPFATDGSASDDFSASTTFTAGDNGSHTITARAFDAAGNSTTSNALAVTVNISGGGPTGPDDAYRTFGNTELLVNKDPGNVPNPDTAAVHVQGSVLDNDGADAVTMVGDQPVAGGMPGEFITDQGATVTMNADGTFSYRPAVGKLVDDGTGAMTATYTDTFTYTNSNDETVTITVDVSELIWYVDNTADAGGNGTSAAPFNVLADLDSDQTPDDAEDAAHFSGHAGDYIFLFEGDGTDTGHNGGVVILANQKLIGQGVDLVIDGVTLVTAAGAPIISNASSDRNINVTSGYGVVLDSRSVDDIVADNTTDPTIIDNTGVVISGLTIQDTIQSGIIAPDQYGTNGPITIENVTLSNNGGPAFTDASDSSSESAIELQYAASANEPDSTDAATIRNVTIDTPHRFGIYASNLANLEVDSVEIGGLQDPTLLTKSMGFGGEGIGFYSSLSGSLAIHDSTIGAGTAQNVDGIRVFKCGATGPNTLTVDLNANEVSLATAASGTRGIVIANFEDGADGADFGTDTPANPLDDDQCDALGTVTLAGTGNTVAAETDFTVSSDDEGQHGTVDGSVGINGSPVSPASVDPKVVPAFKRHGLR